MTKKPRNVPSVIRTFSRAFANYKPPEALTVSQWAEKYRVLSRESSAEAGRWRNERTPYMVEIMDAFTDPKVEKISVVASSQVGKTEIQLNIAAFIIDQDPSSILYIQPSIEEAKKFSRLRIAPMIRDCKKISGKVTESKARENGNTVLQKSFPGGMLTIIGSNSASALASTPVKYVLGDERDRWALSAGNEGDPWKLAEARTATFFNHKMVDVSTPTIKGASAIETSFLEGTQETWQQACPCCDVFHEIDFDDIHFQFDTIQQGREKDYLVKDIYWVCPDCGYMATEQEMRKQPSKWVAAYPEAIAHGHRSFWLKGFSSPWQPWEKIIYAFLRARKDPQRLKVVYNTMLGKLWEDRGDLEDEDTMLSRRELYGTRADGSPIELPEGVLVLTCGVDTQDDRLEYEVVGHGYYGETWGIKKGMIMGDPHDKEVWERLDGVIDKTYSFADPKRGLKISMTFVDSGGHKTQDVYRECAKRIYKRVFAIKGYGGDGIPYTKPPSKVKMVVNGKAVGFVWLYAIGVDAGKTDIMSNLKVQEPGAKFCHFPKESERGYDSLYFSGLLSEKLVMKTEKGRTRWAWVKLLGHERNEALDCRNYALAAFRVLDPDLDAVAERLRGTPKEQQPTKPKRNRVRKNHAMEEGW